MRVRMPRKACGCAAGHHYCHSVHLPDRCNRASRCKCPGYREPDNPTTKGNNPTMSTPLTKLSKNDLPILAEVYEDAASFLDCDGYCHRAGYNTSSGGGHTLLDAIETAAAGIGGCGPARTQKAIDLFPVFAGLNASIIRWVSRTPSKNAGREARAALRRAAKRVRVGSEVSR